MTKSHSTSQPQHPVSANAMWRSWTMWRMILVLSLLILECVHGIMQHSPITSSTPTKAPSNFMGNISPYVRSLGRISEHDDSVWFLSSAADCHGMTRRIMALHARMGGDGIDDDDGIDEEEYHRKLEEAKTAIEEARKAKDAYYYGKKKSSTTSNSFLKADEVSNLLEEAEANKRRKRATEEEAAMRLSRNNLASVSPTSTMTQSSKKKAALGNIPIRSTIEYTDAGTMNVQIPSPGTSANSLVAGAFSAAWFSAIVPATFATGGAGLLFMLPFWAAGGLVAKQAVVDPYLSFQLSVGEYAWSLERTYLEQKSVLTKQVAEGPTQQLQGATVECSIIVNDVPQYEIRLYSKRVSSGQAEPVSIGLGLPMEELEYLADEINKHIETIKSFPDESQLPSSSGRLP